MSNEPQVPEENTFNKVVKEVNRWASIIKQTSEHILATSEESKKDGH